MLDTLIDGDGEARGRGVPLWDCVADTVAAEGEEETDGVGEAVAVGDAV